MDTPDLPDHCDGYGAEFSICHAFDFKKGGLITARHNELRDGVADHVGKAFTPPRMYDDPKTFRGCAVRWGKVKAKVKGKGKLSPGEGGEKGYILILDLWTQGMDSIHDMCVVNTDAMYYQSKPPRSVCRPLSRRRRRSCSYC